MHPLVEAYTVGEDYRIDSEHLLPFDLKASEAHAQMLSKIGVLTAGEAQTLKKALNEIGEMWRAGKFKVERSQEDGHTAIEQYITEKYGEVGKKIHTGRSRNDQSLTMIRLYLIDQAETLCKLCSAVSSTFRKASGSFADVPMPGYTHMQKAMPTTVGRWLGSFADAFQDAATVLRGGCSAVLNQNPLGSAAGFGINHLELDRQLTTKKLLDGSGRLQENPLYCGFSRGFFENLFVSSLASGPMTVSTRFAVDFMMFTQQEFSFFKLGDEYVTGSSIMPQKKNYDLFEIMRANGRVMQGLQSSLQNIIMGLGSGYHRDLQLTKKLCVEAVELCTSTLELLEEAVPHIQVNKQELATAMDCRELFATDEVYKRVAKGESFRTAYLKVKEEFFAADKKS